MSTTIRDPYATGFKPASDYIAEEAQAMQWLVEGFLPLGYLAILGGTSKCGKSCFATALSIAVARNEPFLGMPTRAADAPPRPPAPPSPPMIMLGPPRSTHYSSVIPHPPTPPSPTTHPSTPINHHPSTITNQPSLVGHQPSAINHHSFPAVLWCAYEESRAERMQALRAFGEVPPNLLITHERPLIDTANGLRLIRHWVRKANARLIVIDPLYGAVEAATLAHGPTARAALDGLKRLCEEEQCAALILHHLNKSAMGRDRFAESHQLLAAASMDILMESAELSRGTSSHEPLPRSRIEQGSAIGNPAIEQSSNSMAWSIQLRCKGRGAFANRTLSLFSRSPAHYEIARLTPTEPTHTTTVEATILECLGAAQTNPPGRAQSKSSRSDPRQPCQIRPKATLPDRTQGSPPNRTQSHPPDRGGSVSAANRGGHPVMGQFGVPAIEQSSNQAIQQSSNGLTCRQIAAATGMNLATVRVRMWSLVRSGRVVAKGKRGRTFVYSLP